MTSNWWAANLFVGRIGEAVVESVLSEFGYAVMRSGNEQLAFPSRISGRKRRGKLTPDLLVRDPDSEEERYVEVKARSARPMAVILERVRFDTLQGSFPRTVLTLRPGRRRSLPLLRPHLMGWTTSHVGTATRRG